MERKEQESGDAARLGVLLKVERSEDKRRLVEQVMAKAVPLAEKIRLIRLIDDRPAASLRQTAVAEAPAPAEPEIEIPPAVAAKPAPPRVRQESPAAKTPGVKVLVEARDAADEEYQRRARELAKARRRLFRPLAHGGWMRVFRDRSRIQEFASATGLLKCGLLARSLVLCPEIVATKAAILRDTEFPGLLETVKPLAAECWRHLGLPQYNRLAALKNFLQNISSQWPEYKPSDPLSKQMVFFQGVWPDYLALFVLRTSDELAIRFILAKAMKASKANQAQIDLALARIGTIDTILGDIMRAVHITGWRRYFTVGEVLVNKAEALFFSDMWDSPPDQRREINAWLDSYRSQYEKLALRLREVRRVRYLVPSLAGEGVDRPDPSWLRFWQPRGWNEAGMERPLLWLFEATRQFLLGCGRLLAGTVKLTDGSSCRLGVAALASPVLAITELAKRLHQLKPVLGEMDQSRIAVLRERPEKCIDAERECLRLSDGVVDGFVGLADDLLAWLAQDSLAAPLEIQEPLSPNRARRGSAQEASTIAEPADLADKTVIEALMEAARVTLLLPLALGRPSLLERWHAAGALEAEMATLQRKIDHLKGQPA